MRNSSLKCSGMAHVNEGSHGFTYHPYVYPQVEWTIAAFAPQLHSVTALWPVLIFGPTEGRRLSWPGCLACHPTISVKALKGTQSTDPNQWPGLNLSSSTTGSLMAVPWWCTNVIIIYQRWNPVCGSRVNDFDWVGSGHGSVCQTRCLTWFRVLTCAFIVGLFLQSSTISAN